MLSNNYTKLDDSIQRGKKQKIAFINKNVPLKSTNFKYILKTILTIFS